MFTKEVNMYYFCIHFDTNASLYDICWFFFLFVQEYMTTKGPKCFANIISEAFFLKFYAKKTHNYAFNFPEMG